MFNTELFNEIGKQNKDEIKPLFQKYYNNELKNKTMKNKKFYEDICNNSELKRIIEDFLIYEIYKQHDFIILIS